MADRDVRIRITVTGDGEVQVTKLNNALKDTRSQVGSNVSAMGMFKGALGALGVALTARAVVDLTKNISDQGSAWVTARAAVEATTGSLSAANKEIGAAVDATDGWVSRTNAAVAVNVFFRNGLASSGAEAGKLAQAGQILSSVYEAQGANFEKYIRYISTGNIALADNFNLTVAQVNALSQQIQSTEGLSKAEADLEARKRLLLKAADDYIETMPPSVEATAKFNVAVSNLAATLGERLVGGFNLVEPPITNYITRLNDAIRASDTLRERGIGITKTMQDQAVVNYIAGEALDDYAGRHADLVRPVQNATDAIVEQTDAARSAASAQLSLQGAYISAANALNSVTASSNASIVRARQSLNVTLAGLNRQAEDAERSHAQAVAALRTQIAEAGNRGIEDRQRQLNDSLESLEENHRDRIKAMREQLDALNRGYLESAADDEQEHQDDVDDLTQKHLNQRDELERQIKQARNSKERAALQQRLADEDRDYQQALDKLNRDFGQEVERNKRKHDEQVANLEERITEEDGQYDTQRAKLKADAEDDMARLRAENTQRVTELEQRLTQENEAYARQQADIQRTREEAHARFMEIQAEEEKRIAEAAETARIAREAWLRDTQVALDRVRAWWRDVENAANAAQAAAAQAGSAGTWGGWSGVTGYQAGISYVPRTGLALLHRGETVIPAGGNRGAGGTVINFTYAPVVSLADRYEAEQVLAPMIVNALRGRV